MEGFVSAKEGGRAQDGSRLGARHIVGVRQTKNFPHRLRMFLLGRLLARVAGGSISSAPPPNHLTSTCMLATTTSLCYLHDDQVRRVERCGRTEEWTKSSLEVQELLDGVHGRA